MISNNTTISYGKLQIPVYRVYARPLAGIPQIPESQFTGRENTLFALEIDVEVFGNNFLPAYTQGDNRNVVATDSMKNFVLRQALDFEGATQEEFLGMLGRRFLQTYAQVESIRLTVRELPFNSVPVPQQNESTFHPSAVLFSRSHGDFALATLDVTRENDLSTVTDHQCGRVGLELLKVSGSAFTRFLHDEYTTLPERVDRPLFIHLDVYWKYRNSADLLASDHTHYVPAEQVRDVIQVVFHEFVSESIQHLVHEMGQRLLTRFPQLAEVSFTAQNRTRDQIAVSDSDEKIKVYSDPFSAYGIIKLTVNRSEGK
jgi:urate oxidase